MLHNLVNYYLSQPWHLHSGTMRALDALLAARVDGHPISADALREMLGKDLAGRDQSHQHEADTDLDMMLPGGIAVISVRGVLARHASEVNGACMPRGRSYETISAQLDAARTAGARAIVLQLETPGGIAVGAQECAEHIQRTRAAGTPVHAYVDGYAFSAGYYLAAACDSITLSSAAAATGSIGTIMAFWDSSQAAERQGMRRIVVRSGARKALAQDGEPVDEATLADLQERVDTFAKHFYAHVGAGRDLEGARLAAVTDGRVFDAAAAIHHGLADGIAAWSDYLSHLALYLTETAPMSLFAKKPKTETPDPVTPATASEPPATVVAATLTAAAAIALVASYPAAAEIVGTLAGEGASPEATELAAAKAQLDAERAAHAHTQTQLAAAAQAADDAQAKLDAALKLGPANMGTTKPDVGGDFTHGGQAPAANAAEAALRAWYDQSPAAQSTYAIGGFTAFAAACAAGIDQPQNYPQA
jgi:signal peptide peptidase SppA